MVEVVLLAEYFVVLVPLNFVIGGLEGIDSEAFAIVDRG